mmetsp:Transcript_152601/g.487582  ORF Transcript_152601/g.487582 Transcript_152601/m.487582 type:complete len:488 (+) Transcript_152601:1-1464(+)
MSLARSPWNPGAVFEAGGAGGMDRGMACTELPLDDAVFTSFCRRGRKRLRQMQETFGVTLRLDRQQLVLRVIGPASNVQTVSQHVATLSGPRRPVPAPVWAELMRTRTLQGPEALVERLQDACGCRIHIERSDREVRIFGDEEAVAKADQLLDELALKCTQDMIPISDSSTLSGPTLQVLAQKARVSLRVEPCRLVVYGLKDLVAEALVPLREYVEAPTSHPLHDMQACESNPQDDRTNTLGSLGSLEEVEGGSADDGGSFGSQRRGSGFEDSRGTPSSRPTRQHAMNAWGQAPRTSTKARGDRGGNGSGGSGGGCCVCTTCGCGRFCGHCGTQVWQAPNEMMASVMGQQGQMMNLGNGQMGQSHDGKFAEKQEQGQMWQGGYYMLMAQPQGPSTMVSGGPLGGSMDGVPTSGQMVPVCMMLANGGGQWMSGGVASPSVMQAWGVPGGMMQQQMPYWQGQGQAPQSPGDPSTVPQKPSAVMNLGRTC